MRRQTDRHRQTERLTEIQMDRDETGTEARENEKGREGERIA